MRTPAELTEAFRARGWKNTPQRQLLFRLLHGNMTHPTAERLFAEASEQMPGISLRTVYQTLNDLTSMGELSALQVAGGSTRFDPNVEAHHHALCDQCGALLDVYVGNTDELAVEGLDGFPPTTCHHRVRWALRRLRQPLHTNTQGATPMSLNGTKTHENLKEAFAGESQANRRYLWFAQKADVEGYPDAALFRSVAEGETGHAHGHLEYLAQVGDPATGEPIGDTEDNFKAAIAGETYEYTQMYPGFAKTARDEGLTEIAEWFETLARAEKSHAGRFAQGLEAL